MARIIRNKRQCVELMRMGLLGNAARTCLGIEDIAQFPEVTDWSFRSFISQAPFTGHKIDVGADSKFRISKVPDDMYLSEILPQEIVKSQGEFSIQGGQVIGLFTSEDAGTWRVAAQKASPVEFTSSSQLRIFLNMHKDGWGDELERLLEEFPDHVIETTSLYTNAGIYKKPWVVWEVRKY